MLDIMRKKAAAWVTKLIFAVIIIVFIFFFGYSRMASRYKDGGSIVATVNGQNISKAQFQIAYENTLQMYKNIFKTGDGQLPEGVEKSVVTATVNQLVQQQVIENYGDKIGLEPTELELAEAIKSSSVARDENGQFDEFMYKKRFLPYFAQKYGMDYEYLVKGDLLLQNVQDVFRSAGKAPFAREEYNKNNTKWTFEVSEFDNEAAAKGNANGKAKKVGPINIAERSQLFPATSSEEAWHKVFTLNTGSAALNDPIKAGDKWYRVKIAKIDLPTEASWQKDAESFIATQSTAAERDLFQTWVSNLLKKAKVKTHIQQ